MYINTGDEVKIWSHHLCYFLSYEEEMVQPIVFDREDSTKVKHKMKYHRMDYVSLSLM